MDQARCIEWFEAVRPVFPPPWNDWKDRPRPLATAVAVPSSSTGTVTSPGSSTARWRLQRRQRVQLKRRRQQRVQLKRRLRHGAGRLM